MTTVDSTGYVTPPMPAEALERNATYVGFVEDENGTNWAVFVPGESRPIPLAFVWRLHLNAPLVYLAGPYTKPDPIENTHRIILIADALWNLGVVPVVPHLTLFWHFLRPRTYEEWLRYDLHLMARCDAVLRVPGASHGADGEVSYAIAHGLPVIYARTATTNDCVSAVRDWLHANREKFAPHLL